MQHLKTLASSTSTPGSPANPMISTIFRTMTPCAVVYFLTLPCRLHMILVFRSTLDWSLPLFVEVSRATCVFRAASAIYGAI